MSAKCQQIISWIESLAPKTLAESWDNVGLQLGDPACQVEKVMVSLDVDSKVAAEAIEKKVDLIVTHHPFIFKPMKNLRTDLPQGEIIAELIKAGVSLYTAHTNLDCAPDGVNKALAETLKLTQTEILKVTNTNKLYKIVVFVPQGHQEEVRGALAAGGAGWIGNYSECGFELKGQGTFRPQDETNPYIGTPGKLERVDEYRLETIVPENKLKRAIAAMIKAHPYEEVAYDIYPLENRGEEFGLGLIGKTEKMPLNEFVFEAKKALNSVGVKVVSSGVEVVKKVAVCGGSGSDLVSAAKFKGADVLVTGDVGYHQAQIAQALGIAVIDAGHFATENVVVSKLSEYIEQQAKINSVQLEVFTAEKSEDVWEYM
ncbi:dinuclear metal center YbgI/SA1388 family protein [Desulfitispora alkaliphila]|uniref:Nif3-like dinuclear metal center hexameric protein n=1 Tax=Desulfitispora alkaliphila TaxID=622674 RepID=UPI003D1E041C